MLNARLYRTCWLVAGVALVVALLTLESPDQPPEPPLASAIDGDAALTLNSQLAAVAPERAPGSGPDQAASRWIQGQLSQVPGAAGRVQTQDFVASDGGDQVRLQNVYLVVPGAADGRARAGILVVAPRDTPPGVAGGTTATSVMLAMARASATSRHQRPHIFVSADGSTIGNAGIRWFLSRFSSFPIAAAISLDAPGEAEGDEVDVWSDGRADKQALRLGQLAERSIGRAGGRSEGAPSLGVQLLHMAVPQTFGDQGPPIADGMPAVTLSGRGESPLRPGQQPTADRMALVANSANDLLLTLDGAPQAPAPDGGLELAGKLLRPTVVRLALLLLALPILVCAVDAVARMRRAKVSLLDGLRATGLRTAPFLAALAAGYLLALAGILPRTAAGAPPLPHDASFGPAAGLGLVLSVGVGVLGWLWAKRRARRVDAAPATEAAAALGALSVLLVVLWVVSPYALVMALPASHAALVATSARRRWQVAALVGVALLPVLGLAISTAGRLDSNPVFALWYLFATMADGSRGAWGPILACLIGACLWSLASLVAFRAAKGALSPTGTPPRRRRPPRIRVQIDRPPARGPEPDRW
ncbi:MAG TPA: hypothetical protein VM844_03590 [Miltoncostaeaceae bacterium]|nr:hypothetical protein [Miltoncostaeaceae bacterium]